MKSTLEELAAAFMALSIFSVYFIFFYVYVSALVTFFLSERWQYWRGQQE